MTDISQFFNFAIKIIIGFGIAFQVPIFTIISVRLGIFTKETLRNSRPYFIILFFIIGMFLTPPDILSQVFLALPMWMLFELGILISKDRD
jgi:sec-independent protein translocase protein TatC